MSARFLLFLYSAAWIAALPALRILALLDRAWPRLAGRGLFPVHWLAARRFPGEAPVAAAPPTLWMHAASLGESKGLWALAESLLEDFPPGEEGVFRILLTAQTATGLAFLERRVAGRRDKDLPGGPELAAELAPLDHPGLVDGFLRRHRIVHVCLYEADLWPHYVLRASRLGIPVDLVSARMTSDAMARWRLLHGVWKILLDRMGWILTQGSRDADRLRSLTRTKVQAGGDFKAFHYLAGHRGHGNSGGTPSRRIAFISLYLPELEILLPELPALMERFPLTVFPRLPQEMEAFRRRLLPLGFALHGRDPGARHVLVDSLGKVQSILPSCGSAFVGGSLVPPGCHNLWEPLLAGLKIYVGPHTVRQEDLAEKALEKGVAEVLSEPAGMRAWREPDPGIPRACRDLVDAQMGILEESRAAFRSRMAVVIPRFYLFSSK